MGLLEVYCTVEVSVKIPASGFLLVCILVACSGCGGNQIDYQGTCAEQTEQFREIIISLVTDEFTPVVLGFEALRSDGTVTASEITDTMQRIKELKESASELGTPECNTGTQRVKEALLQYMAETNGYVVSFGLPGTNAQKILAQHAEMNNSALAFQEAFESLTE
jgi:hypothetical protein